MVATLVFLILLVAMNILAATLQKNIGTQVLDFTLNYSSHRGYEILENMKIEGRIFT